MKKKDNQQVNTAPEEAVQDPVEQADVEAQAQADAEGAEQAEADTGGSGARWGILWVVGIAVAAAVIYGLVTTGSFSGMWDKLKRGASETTGGLFGKKKDERDE